MAQQSVALHLIVTPMVMWIWIAALVMGLGGLLALIPVRRTSVILTQSAAKGKDLEMADSFGMTS